MSLKGNMLEMARTNMNGKRVEICRGRAHKYEWKEVRNMARARAPGRGMGVTEGFVGGRGGGRSGAAQAGTDSGPNSVVPNIPTSTPHLLRILIKVIGQDSI